MSESPASPGTVVQARCRPPCRGWQSTQPMLQFTDGDLWVLMRGPLPVLIPWYTVQVSMLNSELHHSVGADRVPMLQFIRGSPKTTNFELPYGEKGNYTSTFGGSGLSGVRLNRPKGILKTHTNQVSMMNCTTVSGLAEYPYYRLHGPITNNCELPETVPRMVQVYMAVNVLSVGKPTSQIGNFPVVGLSGVAAAFSTRNQEAPGDELVDSDPVTEVQHHDYT
ncbi:hypothetical protein Bbelb_282000 [Branchiostoma belcheri]|nr:hypothetical protein Bbelb_282000 [Branchiostoma belcheri]